MAKKKNLPQTKTLRLPAIRVEQSEGRTLYSFAVDGKRLPSFAAISRIHRSDDGVKGYQRPEVLSHIAQIRAYLESASPMIPNAVVLAFDSRVSFEPAKSTGDDAPFSTAGTLVIPIDESWDEKDKPGFVVDGQQRLAAIREAEIEVFPICVTAFITDDVEEHTEQFILVNSTKPLPKGLIYELLPSTGAQLPTLLQRRRFPARLLDRLNHDDDSPFRGIIRTPTNPSGVVKDNSVLRMLEQSLYEGALYRFRDVENDNCDETSMLTLLKRFWTAVATVFPEAWGRNPKNSRLMHGVGIVSMGYVMDAISDANRRQRIPSYRCFERSLEAIASKCAWTEGAWHFSAGQRREWNELQNTFSEVLLLSNFLLRVHREAMPAGLHRRRSSSSVEMPF